MAKQPQDSGHFASAYSLETNADTIDHYRSWAKTYDQEVGEENGYAQPARVADKLVELSIDKSAQILDAGCGSGLSGVALHSAGFKILDGCDFSAEMLEKSAQKACYRSLWEANLNDGQPQIKDESYDVITCVGVFSFGHVFPGACDDLLRLLRADGLFVVALNEQYWDEGGLKKKLEELERAGAIETLSQEFGEHLPGHDVMGWVITMRKTAGSAS